MKKLTLTFISIFLLLSCEKRQALSMMKPFSGGYYLTDVEIDGAKLPVDPNVYYTMDTISIDGWTDGSFTLFINDEKRSHNGIVKYTADRKDYKAVINKPNENNQITVYFEQIKKSIYIEDLSKDNKYYLMTSGLVDEIGGKADTVRYYYTAIQ